MQKIISDINYIQGSQMDLPANITYFNKLKNPKNIRQKIFN